jgi:hypothetical protein
MTARPAAPPGGGSGAGRLSVPRRLTVPPHPLTPQQHAVLLAVADILIPGAGGDPKASAAPGYETWLERSLAARAGSLDELAQILDELAGQDGADLEQRLRRLHAAGDGRFHLLSSVAAGAYLMIPEVRRLIGYPGQHASPPRIDEAADELSGGILDPVIGRGPTYISANGE